MHRSTLSDDALAEPCIGALEKHLHDVFAATLTPGEDFVYCQDAAVFTALDEYCDEQSMGTEKPPLIVLAGAGGGKSALLANWKLRHQRQGQRTRSVSQDKFVFWHAVGCSRPSMQIHSMLRRLMTELVEFFDIARPVPKDDERLSWDLPRFLELAAKKGQIVLLLDGVQNLVSGNSESGFKWLPLSLPPNVRVVLSATANAQAMGNPNKSPVRKQSRVLLELERRKWQRINLAPLSRDMSAAIIEAYLKKTSEGDMGLSSNTFLTGGSDPMDVPMPPLKGLLLFQGQIDAVLAHPAADNPLFVRILLRALHWGATKGFDVWSLVDALAEVVDATSLLKTIMQAFSAGCQPSETNRLKAEARSEEEGGFDHLRLRYSWHPYFQLLAQMETHNTNWKRNLRQTAMRGQSIRDVSQVERPTESISAVLSLGNSVVGNIGDHNWIKVKEEAERKLEQARVDVESDIQSLLESASATAEHGRMSLVDALWERQLGSPRTEDVHIMPVLGRQESVVTDQQLTESVPVSGRRGRRSSTDSSSDGFRTGRLAQLDLPVYLRGGALVQGLGKLVGNALALLYVARLGLKEVELWSILARLRAKEGTFDDGQFKPDSDEERLLAQLYPVRGELVDRLRLHDLKKSGYVTAEAIHAAATAVLQTNDLPSSESLLRALGFPQAMFDSNEAVLIRYTDLSERCERQLRAFRRKRLASRKQSKRKTQAMVDEDEPLDPDVEDDLLSLLCALGILHSPENQVLVLPLGNSVLRHAVRELFVPDESAEAQWHAKLVNYFQECRSSFRKCEELPWHLKVCRRWHHLKDSLVDLSMFELMFRTRLRGELLEYWQLLTQGPLYLSDATEARASETLSTDASQQLLSVLDTSLVFGYTREQASRLAMAEQQTPFDIVHEYNVALEQWEQSTKPTMQHIVAMEETIAAMLLEFGKSMAGTTLPTMLRVYPRPEQLKAIEIRELPGAVEPQVENLVITEEVGRNSDSAEHSAGAETTAKTEQQTHQLSHTLYDYHRWMWTQIPWLALKSVLTTHLNAIDSHRSDGSMSHRVGSAEFVQDDTSTVPTRHSTTSDSRKYWGLKKFDPRIAPVPDPVTARLSARPPSNRLTSTVKEQIRQITSSRGKRQGNVPGFSGSNSLEEHVSTMSASTMASSLPLVQPRGRNSAESSILTSSHLHSSDPADPTEQLLNKILEAEDGNIHAVLSQLIDPNLKNPAYSAALQLQISERNEQLAKLRAMHDKLRTERKRKRSQADKLLTQFQEREVVGEQVVMDLEQAEKVMHELDVRCAKVAAAIEEAARLGRAYTRIVDFCRAHPANVQARCSLLEQEKKLAGRQCDDLMKQRRHLYLLAEEIELGQKPVLVADIEKHSMKRKQTQAAIATLRQRIQSLSQEPQTESAFLTEVADEGGTPGSPASETDAAPSAREAHAVRTAIVGPKPSRVVETKDRRSHPHRKAKMLQKMLGLSTPDKMFQVYMEAGKLGDGLATQKKVSDVRLQQLRTEYASCVQALDDITMVEVEQPSSPTNRPLPSSPERLNTPESQEIRWLDDRYSATEMKLHQSVRKAAKATGMVQQVKTGIFHLSQLLMANKKMLEHLPGSPEPPMVNNDEEMVQILVWCEEKVVAINEALVLDTAKPKAADDKKSLHERQTALAHTLGLKKPGSAATERPRPNKAHGINVSGAILRNEENYIISSPRSIRVPSHLQLDAASELTVRSEPEHPGADIHSNPDGEQAPYEGLQSFIQDAFASEESQHEIRKANILANKKLGAAAGLGWAMEGVLKDIGVVHRSQPASPIGTPKTSHHPSRSSSPTRIRLGDQL